MMSVKGMLLPVMNVKFCVQYLCLCLFVEMSSLLIFVLIALHYIQTANCNQKDENYCVTYTKYTASSLT